MVAKLITHGADREEALARMRRALFESKIEGIDTTIGFHLALMNHPDFRAGRYDTGFLERIASSPPASQSQEQPPA
jgi:acetyl-CoA carboxylase biotin carboxylase subunit